MALTLTSLIKAKDAVGRGPRSQTAGISRKTSYSFCLKPFSPHFLSLVSSAILLEEDILDPPRVCVSIRVSIRVFPYTSREPTRSVFPISL